MTRSFSLFIMLLGPYICFSYGEPENMAPTTLKPFPSRSAPNEASIAQENEEEIARVQEILRQRLLSSQKPNRSQTQWTDYVTEGVHTPP